MDTGPQWVDLTSHCGQQSPGFEMRSHGRRLGVGKWLWVLPFGKEAFRTAVLNLPNMVRQWVKVLSAKLDDLVPAL